MTDTIQISKTPSARLEWPNSERKDSREGEGFLKRFYSSRHNLEFET